MNVVTRAYEHDEQVHVTLQTGEWHVPLPLHFSCERLHQAHMPLQSPNELSWQSLAPYSQKCILGALPRCH